MNPAAQKRDVLNFESGLSYEIALKFPTGKTISNGRVMFSTVDGEVFFLSQDEADQIYDLKLQPQEKFRLIKQGNSRNSVIEVSRISERQVVRPAAPVVAMPEQQTAQQPQNTSLSKLMASSYISAIDALLIARDYAESKGIAFKLSPGEIRASAHCIYISSTRGAR